jgi:hypothetical protein
MKKSISDEINDIEQGRFSEIMAKLGEYTEMNKTYHITIDKREEYYINVTAPTQAEAQQLMLWAIDESRKGD